MYFEKDQIKHLWNTFETQVKNYYKSIQFFFLYITDEEIEDQERLGGLSKCHI